MKVAEPHLRPRPIPPQAAPAPPPVPARPSRPRQLLESSLDCFRFMEIDEEAAVLLGPNSDTAQALGVVDGLVTVYDGYLMAKDYQKTGAKSAIVGSAVRIGLGIGGALPGLEGAACEGLLGVYQTGEGLYLENKETTLTGLTQLGASVGLGMMCLGVHPPVGAALILGSNLGRVLGFAHLRQNPKT